MCILLCSPVTSSLLRNLIQCLGSDQYILQTQLLKKDFLASHLLLSGLFFPTFHSFQTVFNVHLFVITPIPVFVLFIKASELTRCRLELVGAEEVSWGKGNTEQAEGSSRGIGGGGHGLD